MKIDTVAVIGATGTMGANIAGIFASFGDAKVYCVGRDIEKVKKILPKIVQSVRADSIMKNLVPADFSMLEECIANSDLVFESVAEDMQMKADIARQVGKYLREDAVSCTGTSGLSVSKLAECYPPDKRKHFYGVHMFNPPYNMSLCEFAQTAYTEEDSAQELSDYLRKKLLRTVVYVKDSPAFLGNRIGFQFINEALQYAERYKDSGGIDYIDSILGAFTGRTMPPLMTSDFVGLDVHKAIVDNIYTHTDDFFHDTFLLPEFVKTSIARNRLGRKSGAGLYRVVKLENGIKRQTVLDIDTGMFRDRNAYVFPFAEQMKESIAEGDYAKAMKTLITNHSLEAEICLSFLLKYITYSLYTAKQVGDTVEAADDVMATGFNWCPPLAMIQALSLAADVRSLILERLPDICVKVDFDALWTDVKPSRYDYRPYFKSGR